MIQRKQSRDDAQSTDDSGDDTHASISCTKNLNDDADELNDTAHVDDNDEEDISDHPVPQLYFDVGFQLEKFFELYVWHTFYVKKVFKNDI